MLLFTLHSPSQRHTSEGFFTGTRSRAIVHSLLQNPLLPGKREALIRTIIVEFTARDHLTGHFRPAVNGIGTAVAALPPQPYLAAGRGPLESLRSSRGGYQTAEREEVRPRLGDCPVGFSLRRAIGDIGSVAVD